MFKLLLHNELISVTFWFRNHFLIDVSTNARSFSMLITLFSATNSLAIVIGIKSIDVHFFLMKYDEYLKLFV